MTSSLRFWQASAVGGKSVFGVVILKLRILSFSLHNFIIYLFFQENMAPEIQKPAPHFKGTAVVNGQFQDIDLTQYKGKYVVIFFYPLDL